MKIFLVWWKNISVSKKFFAIVGIMSFLILFELVSIFIVFKTLSASRSMVGIVGNIAKAQKNAVFDIQNYLITKNDTHYQNFLNNLQVPLGMRIARIELTKDQPNLEIVKNGFLQASAHESDIDNMIFLMRFYKNTKNLNHVFKLMTTGQAHLVEFENFGKDIHLHITGQKRLNNKDLKLIMSEIYTLNSKFSRLQNSFAEVVGEGSRRLEWILRIILSLVIFSTAFLGIIMTLLFTRHLTKGLKELTTAAKMVGNANFKLNLPVRSHDELGQLATAINDSAEKLSQMRLNRDQAEQANLEKGLFLANMSHEIRTPLNAILGFSEFLVDTSLSKSEKAHYLDIVKRTGKNLIDIINDILDLSKIEASQIRIHETSFSLSQLLLDITYVHKERCLQKNLKMVVEKEGEVSEYILSDSVRLKQILQNIIGNAVKFTASGSVNLTYKIQNDYLVFLVQDTGPGISNINAQKLFQPFSQGDPSITKKYGGTGLGLMISKKLAHMLGGDVRLLNSEPRKGSTFEIRVQYKPSVRKIQRNSNATTSNNAAKIPDLSNKKILVVEDSEDNRLLIQLYLLKSGALVDFATNGQEGVEKALSKNFDAVLMDIQMPIMDGFTATQILRESGFTLPIIALSAYAMKEDQDKSLQMGCSDYLSKPVDRIQLLNLLEQHVRNRSITLQ